MTDGSDIASNCGTAIDDIQSLILWCSEITNLQFLVVLVIYFKIICSKFLFSKHASGLRREVI